MKILIYYLEKILVLYNFNIKLEKLYLNKFFIKKIGNFLTY
jgi:hypothetical protein